MRLRAEQLSATIQRTGLAPIYYISGDEPLQMMEAADEIRHHARVQDYNERIVLDAVTGFEWNSLLQEGSNLSLFSSKRIIELRLGNTKPGKEGSKYLIEYVDTFSSDNILIITSARIDKRTQQTQWFKVLDKAGVTIQVWPVDISHLSAWIIQRAKKYNREITGSAANIIAERVEGNMLAAGQEVEKICLLKDTGVIDNEDVLATVSDSTRYDTFDLIESAFAGNTKRAAILLNGIRNEGIDPAAVYGALLWEYRRLCSMSCQIQNDVSFEKIFSMYRVWDNKRKLAIKKVLKRYTPDEIYSLLRKAVLIDRQIKGSDRPLVWNSIQQFLLRLAGSPA